MSQVSCALDILKRVEAAERNPTPENVMLRAVFYCARHCVDLNRPMEGFSREELVTVREWICGHSSSGENITLQWVESSISMLQRETLDQQCLHPDFEMRRGRL